MIIDTHCHIHESEFFPDNRDEVYQNAIADDVVMLCVSTSERASREAMEFTATHPQTYPIVGVHPHDAANDYAAVGEILAADREGDNRIVGVGEIGLDYYYLNSPREAQIAALEQQLQWAIDYDMPVSFHVRDSQDRSVSVWDDFWPIVDNFRGIRGVLHSFTDTQKQLEQGLSRGFFVGVNGISTFTKDAAQQAMYASIPLERVLLETDAPFLTPAPYRGTMNEPKYVRRVAEHVATVHARSVDDVAALTTDNASRLFTKVGELQNNVGRHLAPA